MYSAAVQLVSNCTADLCCHAVTLRTKHLQLQTLHQQRDAAEGRIAAHHADLQRLAELLQQTQARVQQKGEQLSSTHALMQMRQALSVLMSEISDMDVRIGVLQHQLTGKAVRKATTTHDQYQIRGNTLLHDAG